MVQLGFEHYLFHPLLDMLLRYWAYALFKMECRNSRKLGV